MRSVLLRFAMLCVLCSVSATSFAEGSVSVNTSLQYDSAASLFGTTLSLEAGLGGSKFPNDRLSFFGDLATGVKYATSSKQFQVVGSANGLVSYRIGPWYAGLSVDALHYYEQRVDGNDAALSLGARLPLRYGGISASLYAEPRFEASNIRSFDFSTGDLTPNGSFGVTFLVADALVFDAALSGLYTYHPDATYSAGWDGQIRATWYPLIPVVLNGRFSAGRIESSRLGRLVPDGELLPVYNRTELLLDAGVVGARGNMTYEVSAPLQLRIFDHGVVEGSMVTDESKLLFVSTLRAAVQARLTESFGIHSNLTVQMELSNVRQAIAAMLSLKLGAIYRF